MAVIGCDIPVRVGGTAPLSRGAGVWVKTHFRAEGDYLVATTYLVAAGEPMVFELKIDLRPLEKIAAVVHQRLHQQRTGTTVGFSFAKALGSIKKTAKKIGQSKLVKAVSGTVNSVVKNKAFQIAMPMAAIAAHTTSKAAGGKGVIPGAAGRIVDLGTSAAMKVVPGGALAAASPKALASFGAAQAAITAAAKGKQLSATIQQAQSVLKKGNSLAKQAVTVKAKATAIAKKEVAKKTAQATATAKKVATQAKAVVNKAKASPAVQKAAALKKQLESPAVRAKLLAIKKQADSANAALSAVNYLSQKGSAADKADAQKSRAILNLVAQNDAKIQALAQKNAGGLPALLIDNKGKITRGRFSVKAATPATRTAQTLYLGPGKTPQRGTFSKVAGEYDIVGGEYVVVGSNAAELIGSDATGLDLIGCDCSPGVGATRPPPRPRDRQRDAAIDAWLLSQQKKGALRSRVAGAPRAFRGDGVVSGCFQLPGGIKGRAGNLRISGTAPGLIGCDCGSEF